MLGAVCEGVLRILEGILHHINTARRKRATSMRPKRGVNNRKKTGGCVYELLRGGRGAYHDDYLSIMSDQDKLQVAGMMERFCS